MEVQKYNKAIVAVVIAAVFAALKQFGLTEESTIMQLAEVITVGLGVYTVPNKR